MAGFLEDQLFPVHISRGSAGGPDWPAEIVTLASGGEERNTRISAPLRSYDAAYSVRTRDELYQILELYYVAMGRLYGFRMLDWTDYRSKAPHVAPLFTDQALGTGNGVTTAFPLKKTYGSGPTAFQRSITKPYGTIAIGLNGAALADGFTIDMASGLVSFAAPPPIGAVLTWGGQFHVPVRFDCKLDQVSLRSAAVGDIPSILLKELRI